MVLLTYPSLTFLCPNLYFNTDTNYNKLNSKPEVLLDVHVEGMLEILRDFGWTVDTVTKKFGPSKEGRNDDKIVDYAKNNKNCVVVTWDGKLKKRLRAQEIKFVDLEMTDIATMVDRMLRKDYG